MSLEYKNILKKIMKALTLMFTGSVLCIYK